MAKIHDVKTEKRQTYDSLSLIWAIIILNDPPYLSCVPFVHCYQDDHVDPASLRPPRSTCYLTPTGARAFSTFLSLALAPPLLCIALAHLKKGHNKRENSAKSCLVSPPAIIPIPPSTDFY